MLIKYVLNINNGVMHQITHISPLWMCSLYKSLTSQHHHISLFKRMVYCSTQVMKPLSTHQKPWFDPRNLWWAKWLFSANFIFPLPVSFHHWSKIIFYSP